MVHQDPPLVFHLNVQRGDTFDGNLYKAYTKSGKLVEYVVWPALLLYKDGSTLAKGIVQCMKTDHSDTYAVGKSTASKAEPTLKKHIESHDDRDNGEQTTNKQRENSQDSVSGSQSVRGKSDTGLQDHTQTLSRTVFQRGKNDDLETWIQQLTNSSLNDPFNSNHVQTSRKQNYNNENSEVAENKSQGTATSAAQTELTGRTGALSAYSNSDDHNSEASKNRSGHSSSQQASQSRHMLHNQVQSRNNESTAGYSQHLSTPQHGNGTLVSPTQEPTKDELSWFEWYNKRYTDASIAQYRMDLSRGRGSYEKCRN